jgi:hypothetical protein
VFDVDGWDHPGDVPRRRQITCVDIVAKSARFDLSLAPF